MRRKRIFAPRYLAGLLFGLTSLAACSAEDGPVATESALPASSARETAESNGQFRMQVADAFAITGRGVVLTGLVDSGSVRVGDSVCLRAANVGSRILTVKAIEVGRRGVDAAFVGEAAGILVEGIDRADVTRGAEDELTARCD